jgi:hypothetical protein
MVCEVNVVSTRYDCLCQEEPVLPLSEASGNF